MKRILILAVTFLVSQVVLSQQDLLEHWTLHYMVIDGITYEVTQPHPSNPIYHPGIEFFEDSSGYEVIGFIHFNNYFDSEPPVLIDETTFTVNSPSVTLGDCIPYCVLEGQYLGTILFGQGPRTFDYEIIEESNGNRTLIITTPEGNIAVHGDYILNVDSSKEDVFVIYPNPVEDILEIESSNEISIINAQIVSFTGKKVLEINSKRLRTINLSSLDAGLYFIQLSSIDGIMDIQKIVKDQ